MYLAAIDKRIQVAAPSGVLNLLQERIDRPWGCGAQIIPGLLKIASLHHDCVSEGIRWTIRYKR